jgi:glycosyltransferase involved in cell wall biosynthesis
MGKGGISWQHILCEFTQKFPHTVTFTGCWSGYVPGFEETFTVEQVGETQYIETGSQSTSYNPGFSYASPRIIGRLLRFQPRVIFANAFSMWTAIAVALKPLGRWRVVITYEGGSPGVEYRQSRLRSWSRRVLVRLADAFVANSQAGRDYLVKSLNAQEDRVFTQPFLVPSVQALLQSTDPEVLKGHDHLRRPIFLYVGQIIPRKGLKVLLEACAALKRQGYENFSLLIIGEGSQRPELELWVKSEDLTAQVEWVGKVNYGHLGVYFQDADVFVFPTSEDIWGMVLPEAMALGKPVICSTGAGAAELVIAGENGFLFDPDRPDRLGELMRQFIDHPDLIPTMGERSLQIMAHHTPTDATQPFIEAVEFVNQAEGRGQRDDSK